MERLLRRLLFGLVILPVATIGCRRATETTPSGELLAVPVDTLPTDPLDPRWQAFPVLRTALITQDLVEPRLLTPSTAELTVRAVYYDGHLAFCLRWQNPTDDSRPGVAAFSDACAVQLPQRVEETLPAPQMGDQTRPVEITVWKAVWSQGDLLAKGIEAVYPHASIGHYPFEAPPIQQGSSAHTAMFLQYAPARRLENPEASPPAAGAQDLVAHGPGTIEPVKRGSRANGCRTADGWSVVIIREAPKEFEAVKTTHVAFAVWDGARSEVGSRKMRTPWIPLRLSANP